MINKVIIINPINYGRDSFRVPVGLLTVASVFSEKGADVVWIDADARRSRKKGVEKQLLDNLDADLIATGGLHSSYKSVKEIFTFLTEKNIKVPTLIGGKLAQTLDYLIWEKIPSVDMLCKQEGEYVVESICEHFPDKEKILGIEYSEDGEIVKNPLATIVKSLDEVPKLRWDFIDEKVYFPNKIGYVLSSRGCPYTCKFCRYPDKLSNKYRTLSAEKIIEDIELLVKRFNVRTICFLDEFFLLQKDRVEKICDAVEEKKLNIKWIVSSRADAIKPKDELLLKRMKKLGCSYINIGIESGSQTILDLMNKKLRIEQIETAVEVIRNAGMHIKPAFIFGFPGETEQTAMESVKWRLKMGLKGKYFYATPYPGAPLYDDFKKKYNMDLDEEEDWILKSVSLKDLNVNLTDMSWDELVALDKKCRAMLRDYKRDIRNLVNKYVPRQVLYHVKKVIRKFKRC